MVPKTQLFHFYIPHGSDNTSTVTVNLPDDLELYIPHGSDNTENPVSCSLNYFTLYIPHGSDNTYINQHPEIPNHTTLYPTWFR